MQRGRSTDQPSRLSRILDRLAAQVGPDQFERYFDGQTRLQLDGDCLEVTVPTGFLAQLLDRRFGDQLKLACEETDASVSLAFRVDRDAFPADVPAVPGRTPAPRARESAPSRAPSSTPSAPSAQSARYRLDQFLVGQSNRLAHAAAMRLAQDEGSGSIFVHGICGVGKTHLLQGLVHHYQTLRPRANVRYTTAEAFTNEFITAVRANKVDAFRKGYRRVELLCIDDVHFLANKDATQTELLHTLDAVGLDGAKVAFASDESPRDIRKLSEKLVSRFMSGVVARIDPPDPELREKLVRALALRRGLRLEEPAVKLIAERSMRSTSVHGGSIRELEGLIIQVEAVYRLLPEFASNGSIGVILVRKAFGLQESDNPSTVASRSPRRPIAIEFIIEEVCRTITVDFERLMGKGRHKRVVLARSLISYLARKLTTMSFPEIARAMGRPNHSTVITAQRRLEADLAKALDTPLGAELSPSFPTMTLRELTDRISTQLQRGNQG